ncbi:MAG: hypothetical protein LC662_04910, partial [Rhodothermaceae bacterium]|nr:hypothetical protein [Rhodothermaceae bacterium]
IHIVFGLIMQGSSGRPTNTLIAVAPDGNILVEYNKIHLFSLAGENEFYDAGESPASFSINGVRIGASICYDLRFAELYRHYSGDCRMVITIANWPEPRIRHWKTLLKARAIENQFFSCGVNRTGTDRNDLNYTRSSYIFDPLGDSIQPEKQHDLMDIFTIDLDQVDKVRNDYPFIKDRKTELFSKIRHPG